MTATVASGAVSRVLDRLERVRRSGDHWSARCPSHADRVASLSVAEGEGGRALVHCHAGCHVGAVAAALGLELRDLFEPDDSPNGMPAARRPSTPRQLTTTEADLARLREGLDEQLLARLEQVRGWTPTAVRGLGVGFDGERIVLPYRDQTGALVGVGRYQPTPERRNGSPKMIADAGSHRQLFPAPELIAEGESPVFLVEGEPDALRLLSCGLAAVGVPGVEGWRSEWAERFRGQRVCVCFDCDGPGRRAAQRVASDLVGVAVDVRLLDLDPARDDGYDVSDFLAGATTAEMRAEARQILERCFKAAPKVEAAPGGEPPAAAHVRFEALEAFVAEDEPTAEALLGVGDEEALLAADGTAIWYGDAGSSKSTLANDLAAHAAAGLSWLGLFTVARPLRVAVLENEGARARFRLKLRRKAATWDGPPFAERVFVYAHPWAEFTLADEHHRAELAAFLAESEIDLLIAGPMVELGAAGAGTPDDVSAFGALLADLRRRAGRPVAIVLLHHENKGRDVSGAWPRLPDTLVHVRLDERERTSLHIRKARHSSRAHGARLTLRWLTDSEGFEVVESDFDDRAGRRAQEEVDALAWLASHVAEHFSRTGVGIARGKLESAYHEAHGRRGRNLARRVIDAELALAAAAENEQGTGERPHQLAAGPGEVRNGCYLYPASQAPSPLAAPPNGEGGEAPSTPPVEAAARRSPPPIEKAARRRAKAARGHSTGSRQ